MPQEISENYSKVYDQAIKYLGMRSHTVFELRTKLSRKKFEKSDVEEVLDDLVEQKYLNDRDFAQAYAQNLIKYKTFGYYGLKMKLKQRGINNTIIEEVLAEELSIEQEKKIAEKAISKSSKKEKIKLMQMLSRKGFRSQAIAETVGEFEE
jgi:regulatory protein